MLKIFNSGGIIKFVITFVAALAVSSLLLTIEWFTWGAWIFVSLMLTWRCYLLEANASNQSGLWQILFNGLKQTNDKLDDISTRLSTKTNNKYRHRYYKSKRTRNKND